MFTPPQLPKFGRGEWKLTAFATVPYDKVGVRYRGVQWSSAPGRVIFNFINLAQRYANVIRPKAEKRPVFSDNGRAYETTGSRAASQAARPPAISIKWVIPY